MQLDLPASATIVVSVTDPAGDPVPGRIKVICDEDPCPGKPSQAEIDNETDKLPPLWAGIYFADVTTGEATFDLPAGPYRVVVSRGMAWSVWPPDGVPDGGFAFTAVSDQTETLSPLRMPRFAMTPRSRSSAAPRVSRSQRDWCAVAPLKLPGAEPVYAQMVLALGKMPFQSSMSLLPPE